MPQSVAEKLHSRVDLVQVHLRQRAVDEPHIGPRRLLRSRDVLLQGNADVLGLALRDLLGHGVPSPP